MDLPLYRIEAPYRADNRRFVRNIKRATQLVVGSSPLIMVYVDSVVDRLDPRRGYADIADHEALHGLGHGNDAATPSTGEPACQPPATARGEILPSVKRRNKRNPPQRGGRGEAHHCRKLVRMDDLHVTAPDDPEDFRHGSEIVAAAQGHHRSVEFSLTEVLLKPPLPACDDRYSVPLGPEPAAEIQNHLLGSARP